jgi:hypothetical protein
MADLKDLADKHAFENDLDFNIERSDKRHSQAFKAERDDMVRRLRDTKRG